MSGNLSLWMIVDLGMDRPWLCPACHDEYLALDSMEERVWFLIGLSGAALSYLNGAKVEEAVPPPGTACRACWRRNS